MVFIEEKDVDKIVAISDLHLGNIRTDYEAIQHLFLHRLWKRGQKGAGRMLVVIGDLIDSSNMYQIQSLLQLPRTFDIQRILLLWLNDLIDKDVEKILVVGNHERNLERNNILPFLKALGWKIYKVFYCIRNKEYFNRPTPARTFLFVHCSVKSSRGSRIVSKTPLLQFFDYILAREIGADFYVAGHIHKNAAALVAAKHVFVTLSSFMYEENSAAVQLYSVPAAFCYYRTSDTWRFEVFQRDLDYILSIEERNYKLLSRIIDEYIDKYEEMIYDNAKVK